MPDAVYVADTGIGLAFGSVDGGFGLLERHYGERLRYVQDVYLEWSTQASRRLVPPSPFCRPEERAEHNRLVRIKGIASALIVEMPKRFGDATSMGLAEVTRVDQLIDDLHNLPPAKARRMDSDSDRGECASVRLGELLEPERRVVILCCNDHRGSQLAYNNTLAHRNMVGVLREMSRAGLISPEDAKAHYMVMSTVTSVPDKDKAVDVEDFT